jgi:hypothetical protein
MVLNFYQKFTTNYMTFSIEKTKQQKGKCEFFTTKKAPPDSIIFSCHLSFSSILSLHYCPLASLSLTSLLFLFLPRFFSLLCSLSALLIYFYPFPHILAPLVLPRAPLLSPHTVKHCFIPNLCSLPLLPSLPLSPLSLPAPLLAL